MNAMLGKIVLKHQFMGEQEYVNGTRILSQGEVGTISEGSFSRYHKRVKELCKQAFHSVEHSASKDLKARLNALNKLMTQEANRRYYSSKEFLLGG